MTNTPSSSPLKIAVLISGGGTTLRNLLEKIDAGELDVQVVGVVSSTPKARGLEIAAEAGIPSCVFETKSFDGVGPFSEAVFEACRGYQAELVVMGGFLKLVAIPSDFEGRVVNIHPGLIPAFCGHGFYGHRVHQAVLDYGAKVSGCTVHFVDDHYDHGPIILQRVVEVAEDDTADTLAKRVFEAECEAYPEALRLYAAGRLQLEGRTVRVLPPK